MNPRKTFRTLPDLQYGNILHHHHLLIYHGPPATDTYHPPPTAPPCIHCPVQKKHSASTRLNQKSETNAVNY